MHRWASGKQRKVKRLRNEIQRDDVYGNYDMYQIKNPLATIFKLQISSVLQKVGMFTWGVRPVKRSVKFDACKKSTFCAKWMSDLVSVTVKSGDDLNRFKVDWVLSVSLDFREGSQFK